MTEVSLASVGLVLVILGFILAFIAVITLVVKSRSSGSKTRGAGILLIGPLPIVFGTDRESAKVLIILAIILVAVVLVFMILPPLLLGS